MLAGTVLRPRLSGCEVFNDHIVKPISVSTKKIPFYCYFQALGPIKTQASCLTEAQADHIASATTMPCAICLDDFESHVGGCCRLDCRHAFGPPCLASWCSAQARLARPPSCPVCRRRVSPADAVRIIAAGAVVCPDVLHGYVAEGGDSDSAD